MEVPPEDAWVCDAMAPLSLSGSIPRPDWEKIRYNPYNRVWGLVKALGPEKGAQLVQAIADFARASYDSAAVKCDVCHAVLDDVDPSTAEGRKESERGQALSFIRQVRDTKGLPNKLRRRAAKMAQRLA